MARVILGVTGGIAAYKACELCRLLVKAGHEVTPVLTADAELDLRANPDMPAQGVAIERHEAEKDASDAELALARAISEGADEVVILGGIGGQRLDHELANLLLLADRRWAMLNLRIARGGAVVRAVRDGQEVELQGEPGDLVTLLPIGSDATGVTTKGLRYPLLGETLSFGRTRGLSNEVEHAPASVSLERGTLLVIETGKEPRP